MDNKIYSKIQSNSVFLSLCVCASMNLIKVLRWNKWDGIEKKWKYKWFLVTQFWENYHFADKIWEFDRWNCKYKMTKLVNDTTKPAKWQKKKKKDCWLKIYSIINEQMKMNKIKLKREEKECERKRENERDICNGTAHCCYYCFWCGVSE